MFLARPDVIAILNSYYVPLNLDIYLPKGSEYWYRRLKAELVAKYAFANGPSAWIIAPDGRVLRCIDVKVLQHREEEALAHLKAVIEEQHIKPGPRLSHYVPPEFKALRPDDAMLHVNARFLLTKDLQGLDPRVPVALDIPPVPANPAPIIPTKELFGIRLVSPVNEWVAVSAAVKEQLLPPAGSGVGARYSVPPEASVVVLNRLCPPTFNAHLRGAILTSDLDGRVVSVGDETVVQLHATFAREHRLWGGPDENIAEGTAVGYLAFDTATRRLTRFGMTTDPGIYGNRKGFRVPFLATVALWQGGYQRYLAEVVR